MPRVIAPLLSEGRGRFAIVVGRFNELITEKLRNGAIGALRGHGVDTDNDVWVVDVPGAWELPIVAQRLANTGRFDAVLAIGCVIRGSTPHFDFVSSGATSGLGRVAHDTGVPIIFGVLTTDTIEQAIERAGTKMGNKGVEAAVAALETVAVLRAIDKLTGEV